MTKSGGKRFPRDAEGLTPKQKIFIEHYALHQNGAKAAAAAGVKGDSAKTVAAKWLSRVHVKQALQRRLDKVGKKLEKKAIITKERWLQELRAVALSNMDDHAQITQNGLKLTITKDRPRKFGRAIRKISETTTQHGGSQSLELHNKIDALGKIGQHFGWVKNTLEVSGRDGGVVPFSNESGKSLTEKLDRISKQLKDLGDDDDADLETDESD